MLLSCQTLTSSHKTTCKPAPAQSSPTITHQSAPLHHSSLCPPEPQIEERFWQCVCFAAPPPWYLLQVWLAPWRTRWPSPLPWPRVEWLTWSSGRAGANHRRGRWGELDAPICRGKRRGGWRMTPTATSATARKRLALLQVGKPPGVLVTYDLWSVPNDLEIKLTHTCVNSLRFGAKSESFSP